MRMDHYYSGRFLILIYIAITVQKVSTSNTAMPIGIACFAVNACVSGCAEFDGAATVGESAVGGVPASDEIEIAKRRGMRSVDCPYFHPPSA